MSRDAERYENGERDHHAVAAFLADLKVSDPDRHLEPLHHELYFSTAHAGPSGELSMVVLRTKYGSPDEQGVRLVELAATPGAGGLSYRVTRSTFIPQPASRGTLDSSYLRPSPSSRNYRLAVKPTGDHKS